MNYWLSQLNLVKESHCILKFKICFFLYLLVVFFFWMLLQSYNDIGENPFKSGYSYYLYSYDFLFSEILMQIYLSPHHILLWSTFYVFNFFFFFLILLCAQTQFIKRDSPPKKLLVPHLFLFFNCTFHSWIIFLKCFWVMFWFLNQLYSVHPIYLSIIRNFFLV